MVSTNMPTLAFGLQLLAFPCRVPRRRYGRGNCALFLRRASLNFCAAGVAIFHMSCSTMSVARDAADIFDEMARNTLGLATANFHVMMRRSGSAKRVCETSPARTRHTVWSQTANGLDWEGHALDITHAIQGWLHLPSLPAACVWELNQSRQQSNLKPSAAGLRIGKDSSSPKPKPTPQRHEFLMMIRMTTNTGT